MVRSCSAYKCTNRFSKSRPDIHFFRFPLTRPAVCKKWYTAMRRKNWFPTKASSLCSDHFVSDDFIPQLPGQNAKRLKLDAVPSQFDFTPVTPKNVKKQKKKKRILKPSKPEKVLDDKIKSKPEEEKYVKPNILYLTSADTNNYILPDSNNYILPDSNNFILPDSNEIKQNRTTLYETDELKSSEESNTETSSEAEDEMNLSDYDAYSDDSSHVLNSSIIPMSKEKLWLRLQNMTDRYERTLEKMEAYRENWKLCMKEVTVLQKIIDNLKEINSITDDR